MAVYCYRCGQRLAGGVRRCPSCGAAIFYDENGLRNEAREAGDIKEEAGYGSAEENAWESRQQTDSAGGRQQTDSAGSWQQTEPAGSRQQTEPAGSWQQTCGGGAWQTDGRDAGPSYAWPGQNPRRPYEAGNERVEGYARLSSTLGIISAILCFFMPFLGLPAAVAALVLGILGRRAQVNKGRALTGLVMGIIFVIINALLVGMTVYYLLHPELLEDLLRRINWAGR